MSGLSPNGRLSSVHDYITKFHPDKTDPSLMRLFLDRLLNDTDPLDFVICYLVVQSLKSATDKKIFRVKLIWTGRDVKSEITRLYAIPIDYQVIIVNDQVVKDDKPLSDYNFRTKEQTIYLFLVKEPVRYRNSGIRIKDILPQTEGENLEAVTAEDLIKAPSVNHRNLTDSYQLDIRSKDLVASPRDSGFYSCSPSVITADGMPCNSAPQKKNRKRRGKKK